MAAIVDTVSAPGRHIALLIDADNVSAEKLPLILAELAKYGTANVRRAYGDWTAPTLKGWTAVLHEYAIRPMQQFSYSRGKNATDMALVIDAMELLYTQRLAAFCIASSDADFTPLVMHLRAAGQDVYGFGERKTPEPFVNACTTFLFLDTPTVEVGHEPIATPAKKAANKNSGGTVKASAKPERPLVGNAKLVTILRGAVEASARDDGWALMSSVGNAARRQAPIDPRNYGAKTFTQLIEATGLFELFKAPDGRNYAADKRNKERSESPTL